MRVLVLKFIVALGVLATIGGLLLIDHSPPVFPVWAGLKSEQHSAYHTIILTNGDEKARCVAYALSAHVLLTAQHCDLPDAVLYVDQPRSSLIFPTIIDKKIFDGHDHMLIVALGLTFTHFIRYDPDTYRGPTVGEAVYIWGSPQVAQDQYREGLCTGHTVLPPEEDDAAPGVPLWIFALPVINGDSGSAIFGSGGQVVGVVTWKIQGSFVGGYTLAFTRAQMREAKMFHAAV